MINRTLRTLRTLLTAAAPSFSVAIALAVGLALAGAVFAQQSESQQANYPGRIAFVGNDNQIYSCDGSCPKAECLTCRIASGDAPSIYSLPTFAPDAQKLAFITRTGKDRTRRFAVDIYDFQRQVVIRAFDSAEMPPIYLYWLPDSKNISFLGKEPEALSLVVVPSGEPGQGRIVNTGAPFYFDWSPAGTDLALHITSIYDHLEQVVLAKADNRDHKKVLSQGVLSFRTPIWSPNHQRLAYCGYDKGRFMLMVADADGSHPKALVTLPPAGESGFVWAPDSYHIAYSSSPVKGVPIFAGIRLVDVVNNTSRAMTTDAVMGFFFSPIGKQLAYIALPPEKSYATWKIVDVDSASSRGLSDFTPTPDDTMAYEHFDQYSLSHSIWSPDSRALVYAGLPVSGEHSSGDVLPIVWRQSIAAGSQPTRIGDGKLAFWSPSDAK